MTSLSFFPQERPESCVPACLRMVLTHYGLKHTEVGQIQVIDPTYPPSGYRTLLLGLFETGWGIARNQTILVKPQA
jgi:hypothetical protein